ncbi:hypothetical protein OIO90_004433 [Microbotryomycetes sp. JL221]|nr:hypothetical protein OIO90_004433 [Microbotryomycetes sp. JL221]
MATEHVATELIHPRLPSFEAFVLINDQRVNVYDIKFEGESHVIGYIEAQEDQEFKFGYDYGAANLLDTSKGLEVLSIRRSKHKFSWNLHSPTRSSRVEGLRDSPFANISLTDDDDLATQDAGFVKSVGTIEMQYRRVLDLGWGSKSSWKNTSYPGFEKQNLHEQTKKASVSHQAELGEAKAFRNEKVQGVSWCKYLDPREEEPYVKFEFRYRSRFLLESEGRLPAHMMPAPSTTTETTTIDLTAENDGEKVRVDDEIERLKRRLADLEHERDQRRLGKKPKIKHEGESDPKSNKFKPVILD